MKRTLALILAACLSTSCSVTPPVRISVPVSSLSVELPDGRSGEWTGGALQGTLDLECWLWRGRLRGCRIVNRKPVEPPAWEFNRPKRRSL